MTPARLSAHAGPGGQRPHGAPADAVEPATFDPLDGGVEIAPPTEGSHQVENQPAWLIVGRLKLGSGRGERLVATIMAQKCL